MKKNIFLTHLESLTPSEVRKFGIFLNATYSNSKVLLRTYRFYVKYYNKKKLPPELEVVYEEVFSKKPKSKLDIRNLQNGISDLFQKLKEYLIQQKVLECEFEKEFIWLKILEDKNLPHKRQLQFNGLIKKQKSSRDIWSDLNELRLYHHDFFRNNFEKASSELKLIEDGIQLLDNFYLSLQLKYATELLNRQNLLSIRLKRSEIFSSILSLAVKNHEKLSLQNQLYLHLYNFLNSKDKNRFNQVRRFLLNHGEELHQDEKLTTLLYLLNYLAEELKQGNYKLRKDAFELYKFGLRKDKLLIHKGVLDHVNYRNIVNLACHLKEYTWAENFIIEFQEHLENSVRTENVTITKSMLFFEKGEFSMAIENITKTNISGIFYVVLAKIYTLACEYELDEEDDLEIACESFIRFVKRSKKLGEGSKNAAVNFGKLLSNLILRKLTKEKLLEGFENSNPLYFRNWLEKKLENYSQASS